MKSGKTIEQLAQELERQKSAKRDFIAPMSKLEVVVVSDEQGNKTIRIAGLDRNGGSFGIRNIAHDQIAACFEIPKRYYNRMREMAPELLATNINHWFQKESDKRMIRTLDGDVRAFLSNRYRPLDNYELVDAVMPALQEQPLEINSTEITDSHLYIQATFPKMEREVAKGDVVRAGIVISNSEVGMGSLRVEPMVYRLICLNGAVMMEAIRKYHVGRRAEDGDFSYEIFRDDTRAVTDAAFWLQARDVVKAAMTEATFQRNVTRIIETTAVAAPPDVEEIVEIGTKNLQLSDGERKGFLANLIRNGASTQWDVTNAITALANEAESYDRAVELERMGGEIIELKPREFYRMFSFSKI